MMPIGIDNTENNRRDWRELLYTAPDLGKYISGAIMFEETLYQSCADGKPFVDVLRDQGITPGIKVDGGLEVITHLFACTIHVNHVTCAQMPWLAKGQNLLHGHIC